MAQLQRDSRFPEDPAFVRADRFSPLPGDQRPYDTEEVGDILYLLSVPGRVIAYSRTRMWPWLMILIALVIWSLAWS